MRLNRGTAVFIALLAVVIVVAVILLQSDDDAAEATPVAQSETIDLFADVSDTDITQITIAEQQPLGDTRPTAAADEQPLPTVTPVPEGESVPTETVSLALTLDESGIWTIAEDSTVTSEQPVLQATVTNIFSIIVNLSASQSFVPDNGDYAQYGLDNPQYEVTFTTSEDTYRLRLGERTLSGTDIYALLNDDDETVYLVSNAGRLERSVLNLIDTPPFAPPPTATPLAILNVPGLIFGNFAIENATSVTLTDNENGTSYTLTKSANELTWQLAEGDIAGELDQTRITIYMSEFASIRGAARANVDDLDALGLNPPAIELSATDASGRSYRLQLGNTDPTGTLYYALVDDFEDVVLVEAGSVELFIELARDIPVIEEPDVETTEEVPSAEATEESDS